MGAVPYDRVKRALDVAAASAALVVLSPVLAGVGIAVAVNLGRPVLFRQRRPGRDGVTFELAKFRSMRSPDPARGLVTDQERLTPFGKALRATSLDELPSLWNVLKGDMSIVGPRPLLAHYLDLYTPEQARRHDVRPGITGLAQARGRNGLAWEERFALDTQYVEQRSLALDARILLETVIGVVRRQGVSAEGHVTMPEFRGRGAGTA
jgi:lipopolysaccharide/colanic/teichoic acid biosynthesis glycosyltransferase